MRDEWAWAKRRELRMHLSTPFIHHSSYIQKFSWNNGQALIINTWIFVRGIYVFRGREVVTVSLKWPKSHLHSRLSWSIFREVWWLRVVHRASCFKWRRNMVMGWSSLLLSHFISDWLSVKTRKHRLLVLLWLRALYLRSLWQKWIRRGRGGPGKRKGGGGGRNRWQLAANVIATPLALVPPSWHLFSIYTISFLFLWSYFFVFLG